MLGLGLSLQKGVSAFNAGRALVSSYIRRVTDAGGVLQNTACDVAAINELNQDRLLEPASWVLVPDGIKEDVVYAQKPSTGLGDLTFTRASDATYTDASGVVRRSPYNLFTQSVWTGGGLNVAPTGWSQSQTTGNFEPQTAINGSVPYRFYGTSARRFLLQTVSLNAGQDARVSLFVNSVSVATDIGNIIVAIGASNLKYYVNNIEVVSSTLLTANSRVELSFTAPTTGTYTLRIGGGSSNASTYDYVISQPQIVEGTSALDYFPTTNRQDVPRIDFRNADGTLSSCGRLLLEPQRTNSIRNSSMVGAVAGTPGTLPTNWSNAGSAISTSIVGSGTENGLPYVDIRLYGTASVGTSGNISFETNTQIAASNGQTWTGTIYAKILDQPTPPLSYNLIISERNSSGDFINENIYAFTPTTSLQRFFGTKVLSGGATTAFIVSRFRAVVTLGQTCDFTIRIAAPQMELGAYATTWVPTTTAAVTRLADSASKTGVSSIIGQTEGTLFVEFDNSTTAQGTTRRVFVLSDGTSNNRIGVSINTVNSMDCFVTVGAVSQASIIFGTTSIQRYKIALAYAQNDVVFYVNGVQIGIDTSATIPSLSGIYLGRETGVNDLPLGSGYNQAALFTTRLTNDQLEVLTSEGYGNYALLAQSLNCVLQ